MKKRFELYDVVRELSGNIYPIGCSCTDKQRLDNLNSILELVDKLISDIYTVSQDSVSKERSIMLAGNTAKEYLKSLKDQLLEDLSDNN